MSSNTAGLLEFDYQLTGDALGSLSLQVYDEDSLEWETIWTKSGDEGAGWQSASLDITNWTLQTSQFRFKAVTGSDLSTIAIDNIDVTETCSGEVLTIHFDIAGFTDEVTWEIRDSGNNVVHSGGPYDPSTPPAGIGGTSLEFRHCFPLGEYTFNLFDSWGDGCSMAYSIRNECGTYYVHSDRITGAGDSHTFNVKMEAPGGVVCNLGLWLRADKAVYSDKADTLAGSTAINNTESVLSWDDYSGHLNNAATNYNGTGAPTYYDNATNKLFLELFPR